MGRRYPTEYHLRAHFQGLGAAGGASGSGTNEPVTILSVPIDTLTPPTNGQSLVFSSATGMWEPTTVVTSTSSGFGFSAGGILYAGELLGFGTWSTTMTFTNSDLASKVQSEFPAAATATLLVKKYSGGTHTQIGTVTFALGATTGTVAWSSSPTILAPFTILELYAPTTQDASLAYVTGLVHGVSS